MRVTSVRNISAIHTGENAIIPSSMSYFLGWNYCGAALYSVPGQQLNYLCLEKKHRTVRESKVYLRSASLESVNSRSTDFAVELSGLSQENL